MEIIWQKREKLVWDKKVNSFPFFWVNAFYIQSKDPMKVDSFMPTISQFVKKKRYFLWHAHIKKRKICNRLFCILYWSPYDYNNNIKVKKNCKSKSARLIPNIKFLTKIRKNKPCHWQYYYLLIKLYFLPHKIRR